MRRAIGRVVATSNTTSRPGRFEQLDIMVVSTNVHNHFFLRRNILPNANAVHRIPRSRWTTTRVVLTTRIARVETIKNSRINAPRYFQPEWTISNIALCTQSEPTLNKPPFTVPRSKANVPPKPIWYNALIRRGLGGWWTIRCRPAWVFTITDVCMWVSTIERAEAILINLMQNYMIVSKRTWGRSNYLALVPKVVWRSYGYIPILVNAIHKNAVCRIACAGYHPWTWRGPSRVHTCAQYQ